jgi:hypothetical protein
MWAWVEIAAGRADSTGGGGPLLRKGEGARGGREVGGRARDGDGERDASRERDIETLTGGGPCFNKLAHTSM